MLRDRGHAPLLGMDRDLEDVVGRFERGLDAIYIDSNAAREVEGDPNVLADVAVVALTRA